MKRQRAVNSKPGRTRFQNPRLPSVPATLEITLGEWYSGAIIMGLMAAQQKEPDQDWASDFALNMGEKMARKARARRRKNS